MPINLILADDHPVVLCGLDSLFRAQPDMRVMVMCNNGDQTLDAVSQYRPDVLILDLRMPGKDGLTVLREMQRLELPTRVVILTGCLSAEEVSEAMRLGARGVMLKEMAAQLLVQCVRKVHAGEIWFERQLASAALQKVLKRELGEHEARTILTPREIDVVRMVANGLRNKDIAKKLSITEGTVKLHLHNIYQKLKLDGRLALTLYAIDKGLVRSNVAELH